VLNNPPLNSVLNPAAYTSSHTTAFISISLFFSCLCVRPLSGILYVDVLWPNFCMNSSLPSRVLHFLIIKFSLTITKTKRKKLSGQWLGYGLDEKGSIPGRGERFTSQLLSQSGYGAHPASYPMGTGSSFLGGKAEANHSPPFCIEVKKEWSYTSITPFIFLA
jgi:hypothetical protein